MNTCKDCKWWDAPDIRKLEISMWEPLLGFAIGLCTHPSIRYRYKTHDENPKVDGATIEAVGKKVTAVEMQTGPEFGCVHWGAKKSETNYPLCYNSGKISITARNCVPFEHHDYNEDGSKSSIYGMQMSKQSYDNLVEEIQKG
jgi:hypothetical protein